MASVHVWPHYEIASDIKTMADLRKFFPSGAADELNWCFLSTSGVHGSYWNLDDIERDFARGTDEDGDGPPHTTITVLIVCPRLVVMRYGNVEVSRDDVAWLRNLCASSIAAVQRSQSGNLP